MGSVINPNSGACSVSAAGPALRRSDLRHDQLRVEMVRMNLKTKEAFERRERQRFNISAPLTLSIGNREIAAYTRDLSNRGVYFYLAVCDSLLIEGEFEFVVELPPEITLSTCCRIRCKGRALRKEENQSNLTGVAAEILHYSILRDFAPAL
jgi:hypothetical protein